MKKTLVALAALAATGAFAQVTITGTVAAGYRISNDTAGNAASGFGSDTTVINFAAAEDLGGGYKVNATLGFDGVNRGSNANYSTTATGAAAGGDTNLTLTTPVGAFSYDLSSGPDFMSKSFSGVGGVSWDGKVTSANIRGVSDAFIYTLPYGAFTFNWVVAEGDVGCLGQGSAGGAASTCANNGAGALGALGANYQRANEPRIKYQGSNWAVQVRYAMYDQVQTAGNAENRLRLQGMVDVGSVKLGAAYSNQKYWNAGNRTDTAASVGVPFGASTVGANFINRNWTNVPGKTDGNVNGYSVTFDYALSKRTTASVNYANWNATVTDAQRANETNFVLAHTF